MTKEKSNRTRNWTVFQYDDSAPENWRELLDEKHIEWVESPIHDRDLNADGTKKKPHRHLLLMFGGVKSYEQVVDFIQFLNCPIPQRCHNAKALIRYMAHLDNPEKAQYSISDIKGHGGVDIAEMLRPSSSERYALIKEMGSFIKDKEITEFQDIFDYAMANRFDDWFPLLCDSSAFVINQYIKSARHRKKSNVDFETGEIKEEE